MIEWKSLGWKQRGKMRREREGGANIAADLRVLWPGVRREPLAHQLLNLVSREFVQLLKVRREILAGAETLRGLSARVHTHHLYTCTATPKRQHC